MENRNYQFGKESRLCLKNDIENLLKKGDSMFKDPFKVFYLKNDLSHCRLMVSVPKRNFKKAVDRNYIKRIVRESYRISIADYASEYNYDISFIFTWNKIPDFKFVDERVKNILSKILSTSKESDSISVDTID